MAAHPEADGKDGVEIVVLDIAKNLTISLSSNYSITSNSCLRPQLPFLEDSLEMVVDCTNPNLKQLGHLQLSKPQ